MCYSNPHSLGSFEIAKILKQKGPALARVVVMAIFGIEEENGLSVAVFKGKLDRISNTVETSRDDEYERG